MNLQFIKKTLNFNPKRILDIGCNVGQFYKMCRNTWGNAPYYYLIDGNDNVEEDIKTFGVDYKICVLSDKVKEVVWYLTKENLKGTGVSYYRENTKHYSDDNVIMIKKNTEVLDDLFKEPFDFIKMDTQGSEVDIIKGGINLCKKAKYVLLEVALTDYNENAPLIDSVNNYMKSIGFNQKAVLGQHYLNNEIIQKDILYENSISQ